MADFMSFLLCAVIIFAFWVFHLAPKTNTATKTRSQSRPSEVMAGDVVGKS